MYKIIQDHKRLLEFIEWLPELQQGECYYASLFGRKKYHPSAESDKSQLKRFIATSKVWLLRKINQLPLADKGYTNKRGVPIHQDALVLYICINPRSFAKAQRLTLKKLADAIGNNHENMNPASIAMSCIHKSKSRTIFVDFDFDNVRFEDLNHEINSYVNPTAYSVLKTKNGFHLLIQPSNIIDKFKKTWHKNISGIKGCDIKGDNLIPVPGCCQGGVTPELLKF